MTRGDCEARNSSAVSNTNANTPAATTTTTPPLAGHVDAAAAAPAAPNTGVRTLHEHCDVGLLSTVQLEAAQRLVADVEASGVDDTLDLPPLCLTLVLGEKKLPCGGGDQGRAGSVLRLLPLLLAVDTVSPVPALCSDTAAVAALLTGFFTVALPKLASDTSVCLAYLDSRLRLRQAEGDYYDDEGGGHDGADDDEGFLLGEYSLCDALIFPYVADLPLHPAFTPRLCAWAALCRTRPAAAAAAAAAASADANLPESVYAATAAQDGHHHPRRASVAAAVPPPPSQRRRRQQAPPVAAAAAVRSPCACVPGELLRLVLEYTETHEALPIQHVSRQWRREAESVLRSRLPVVSGLLPMQLVHDGWRMRVGVTSLRVTGKGALSATGNMEVLAKLLSWLERLMNPAPPGEPTSPPWAPGGDKRRLEVEVAGNVAVSSGCRRADAGAASGKLTKLTVDLNSCSTEQRDAALAFRNWLLVVEELPEAEDNSLGGLSLCPAPLPQD